MAVVAVVVFEYFDKAVFIEGIVSSVVDVGVEEYRYFGGLCTGVFFEKSVVFDGFGDG